MCIIVAKPVGVEFPSWERLKCCFDNNPDGAGFMWNENGLIHIEKGFMSFGSFKKALKMQKKHFTDDTAVVMHFRIKTSGEVSRECCHPFPLDNNLLRLRDTRLTCKVGVAHNGVIYGRDTTTMKSDTMDFIMNYLYHLNKLNSNWEDKSLRALIDDELEGDRLCVLEKNGTMHRYGSWTEDEGVYYSNGNYKPRGIQKSWNKYSSYTSYDEYAYAQRNTPKIVDEGFKYCEFCKWCDVCDSYGYSCASIDEVWESFKIQWGLEDEVRDIFFAELDEELEMEEVDAQM